MSFGISNNVQNSALLNINAHQSQLRNSYTKLSSGRAINSAADNPSGLAIEQALIAQANGFDTGAQNVQTANSALNVAQGATTTTADALQRLNVLAVAANNGFLSPQQAQSLQTEASQISQQINTVAQVTQFNGVNLLDGSTAGPQPGNPASTTVTNNDQLSGSGQVVANVTAAGPNFQNSSGAAQGFGGTATTNSTIQVTIVNNNGVAAAQVSATDSGTGQTVTSGALVASGGTVTGFENVNVQLGNFSLADVGQSATIQVQQNNAATQTGAALNIQSGPAQGATVQVGIPALNTQTLQVNAINLGSAANATNAEGQINNAIQGLSNVQARIGAQQVALNYDQQNANIASVNTTASASAIGDLNYGSEVSHNTSLNLLSQIGLNVLQQANASRGYLNAFFNHAA